MNKNRKYWEESLSTIDAAITITDNYPDFKSIDLGLSFNEGSDGIFHYLNDLIKHTEGYDRMLEIISTFLYVALPPLEVSVKAIIISKLKDYFSCSLNPIISEELLLEGMFFSLHELDLCGMFDVSPLDSRVGKHYYYNIEKEEIEFPDELNKSSDFNAVLWYMRNRSYDRQVWYSSYNGKQGKNANKIIPRAKRAIKVKGDNKNLYFEQLTKDDGIITLEYGNGTTELKNSIGGSMYSQVPKQDWIHVFLGNAALVEGVGTEVEKNKIRIKNQQLAQKAEDLYDLEYEINLLKDELAILDNDFLSNEETDISIYTATRENKIKEIGGKEKLYNDQKEEIRKLEHEINHLKGKVRKEIVGYSGDRPDSVDETEEEVSNKKYQPIEANRYYGKTIFQFDIDYVSSVSLFDPKQVTARLIDSLLGLISFDANISVSRRIVREEIKKMVRQVIESSDVVVSDCFFSFSNDDYNRMLDKAEAQRLGLLTTEDNIGVNTNIDPEKILSKLNELSDDATEHENIEVLKNILQDISYEVSEVTENKKTSIDFNFRNNFIENLLTNLAVVICESVLSPKIYLMIAINLKIVGHNNSYDLYQFIAMFKQLLVEIIRKIVDEIIRFIFYELIYPKIVQLAEKTSVRLAKEQVDFYMRLLLQCVGCYSLLRRGDVDWNPDAVYADILEEENNEPIDNEC